jgi:adenine-specific DNA-methyltransferase
MIYIDPPYNTGGDFVYKDDFKDSIKNYKEQTNQTTRTNPETSGRYHTDWLNMMYSRLMLAKNLLSDDGVIFVSIDDNEVENLKKMMNETFGENNTEILVWNKESEGSSGTLKQITTFRRIHEYIVCSFINKNNAEFEKIKEPLLGKERVFQTANLAVNIDKEKTNHKNYYTIVSPKGIEFTRQWKWGNDEVQKKIKENLIYWGSDGNKQPRLIIPTDERRTTYLQSILNYGGTTIGRKNFEEIFNSKIEFNYPKPIVLLKKILETAANKDSIILDFFSGSATTAHAVMQLNAEDGGNRKFIMVQLPEKTQEDSEAYKAGYKNICEIGKERIRRAGELVKKDLIEKNAKLEKEEEKVDPSKLDIGFKVFKLDESNFKEWDSSKEPTIEQLELFADPIKEGKSEEEVLYEVLLKYGVFDQEVKKLKINNKDIYSISDNYLVIMLSNKIEDKDIEEIKKLKPKVVIFRDSGFNGNDTLKINAFYNLTKSGVEEVKTV